MAFAEPLDAFFTDFATTMTVGASSVPGIFDNGYGEALQATGTVPTFVCETAVLSAASGDVGDAVSVGGVNYTIAELHADGSGVTTVILERA